MIMFVNWKETIVLQAASLCHDKNKNKPTFALSDPQFAVLRAKGVFFFWIRDTFIPEKKKENKQIK